MKINEQKYLKRASIKIRRYIRENPEANNFYSQLDTLSLLSLQDLSFKSDLKLFEEFSLIVSVITTIITNPRISNKSEETILRAEQAGSIQSNMFENTMRDASLWKRKNHEMVPEYVHHHEIVDDLKIYENIFIVKVIDLIDTELAKYRDFYVSLLQKFDGQEQLTYAKDREELAMDRLEGLQKRIRRIKNTYFYREVSKAKIDMSHITPTNILLKNRLYNMCYKFYRSMVTYEDKGTLINDFMFYYYILLIKELKRLGFKMNTQTKNATIALNRRGAMDLYQPLTFLSNEYKITTKHHRVYDGIELKVTNRLIRDKQCNSTSHLLLVEPNADFSSVERIIKTGLPEDVVDVEAISLWNLAYLDKGIEMAHPNTSREAELIKGWLSNTMKETLASKKIYSFYCPVCRNKNIDEKNQIFSCKDCGSKFVFYPSNDEDKLWFMKIGRK